MPKINLDYDPMEAREKLSKPKQRTGIFYTLLDALAVHFGWEDFNHYHRNNYTHAKKLKQEVYEMSLEDKQKTLSNLKNLKK